MAAFPPCNPPSQYTSRRGFTIVELMIVVAICGVLVAISITFLSPVVDELAQKKELGTAMPALCSQLSLKTGGDGANFVFDDWLGDNAEVTLSVESGYSKEESPGDLVSAPKLFSLEAPSANTNSPRGFMRCAYRVIRTDDGLAVFGKCPQDDDEYLVRMQICSKLCVSSDDGTDLPAASTFDVGLTSGQITTLIDNELTLDSFNPCDVMAELRKSTMSTS